MPPTRQSTAALPLAPAVFHILLALADGDAHGYRIRADVIERSNGAIKLDPGSLYRLIARLSDDGLVVESPSRPKADDDDERRRYYRLTPMGKRLLEAETNRMADLVALARAKAGRRVRSV
ncbi:MAG: helix-turn-helix transcriptional regulator [Acidobacteria bacterium]|jgi:DNA-binding PadR family transcriptional regulator|nr:helix-turn-helix transcriptional regulator [Acidobacteriota bacterium]